MHLDHDAVGAVVALAHERGELGVEKHARACDVPLRLVEARGVRREQGTVEEGLYRDVAHRARVPPHLLPQPQVARRARRESRDLGTSLRVGLEPAAAPLLACELAQLLPLAQRRLAHRTGTR